MGPSVSTLFQYRESVERIRHSAKRAWPLSRRVEQVAESLVLGAIHHPAQTNRPAENFVAYRPAGLRVGRPNMEPDSGCLSVRPCRHRVVERGSHSGSLRLWTSVRTRGLVPRGCQRRAALSPDSAAARYVERAGESLTNRQCIRCGTGSCPKIRPSQFRSVSSQSCHRTDSHRIWRLLEEL